MKQDTAGPRFGPAGLSDSYKTQWKNALAAVEHTVSLGLSAFEYQSGHGVNLKEDTARKLAADAQAAGLQFSMHAPYYISTASLDEEKRLASVRYLLQSARALRWLGGRRIVFHPGGVGKQPREVAMEKTADVLARARKALDEEGFEDMLLCPETMGKNSQLGTLDEVLSLCAEEKRHVPCLDFGHLNARGQGSLKTQDDFAAQLDRIETVLGDERAAIFHVHFSRIEYGPGGEKRHHTFADRQFGPDYKPFIALVAQRGLSPTIICESRGVQAEDAARMRKYYKAQLRKNQQKDV